MIPADDAPERRKVILLVEDNEVDREVYGRLLWYNGYRLLHASDGESAIALALETSPDLILLDILLEGELTGLDVAVRLRDEGFQAPMIALSGVKSEEFGADFESAGITAYLEKPIDPFEVVRHVLRHAGGATPPGTPRPDAGPVGGSSGPDPGSMPQVAPHEFTDRALAAPVLQPSTPDWRRQPPSASAGQRGPTQLFFPKWQQHPSSGFQRPAWNRPPASAPAYCVFAQRHPLRLPAR